MCYLKSGSSNIKTGIAFSIPLNCILTPSPPKKKIVLDKAPVRKSLKFTKGMPCPLHTLFIKMTTSQYSYNIYINILNPITKKNTLKLIILPSFRAVGQTCAKSEVFEMLQYKRCVTSEACLAAFTVFSEFCNISHCKFPFQPSLLKLVEITGLNMATFDQLGWIKKWWIFTLC